MRLESFSAIRLPNVSARIMRSVIEEAGLAVLAADTFGAGLRLASSFLALTYSLLEYTLVEKAGELVAVAADDALVSPDCREFCQERALGAATQFLNDMHPGLSPIQRIETVLDARRGRHECETVLGVPVIFGAPVTRWILRPGVARAPLPMASPLLEETYGYVRASSTRHGSATR